jgi:hypothetical protein
MPWRGLKIISKHGQVLCWSCEPNLALNGISECSLVLQIPWPCFFVGDLRVTNSGHKSYFLRDAVATDIVHQHSGRLDYYKGWVFFYVSSLFPLFIEHFLEISLNFTRLNRKETGTWEKNMTLKWSTESTCRLSLTAGDIMPIEVCRRLKSVYTVFTRYSISGSSADED